jgi:hypothetical protein
MDCLTTFIDGDLNEQFKVTLCCSAVSSLALSSTRKKKGELMRVFRRYCVSDCELVSSYEMSSECLNIKSGRTSFS